MKCHVSERVVLLTHAMGALLPQGAQADGAIRVWFDTQSTPIYFVSNEQSVGCLDCVCACELSVLLCQCVLQSARAACADNNV